MEHLINLQEGYIELVIRNHELEEETKALKEELTIEGSLEFIQTVYFLNTDEGKDGPYCQRCWDADKKLIRLQDYGDNYTCFVCKLYSRKPNIPGL